MRPNQNFFNSLSAILEGNYFISFAYNNGNTGVLIFDKNFKQNSSLIPGDINELIIDGDDLYTNTIIKTDLNGIVQWDNPDNVITREIDIDSTYIYCGGRGSDVNISNDILNISKLNKSNGGAIWEKTWGRIRTNESMSAINDISSDSSGNFYVVSTSTHIFNDSNPVWPNDYIIPFRKYDSNGSVVWERSYTTMENDITLNLVCTDSLNNLYTIYGSYIRKIDPSNGNTLITANELTYSKKLIGDSDGLYSMESTSSTLTRPLIYKYNSSLSVTNSITNGELSTELGVDMLVGYPTMKVKSDGIYLIVQDYESVGDIYTTFFVKLDLNLNYLWHVNLSISDSLIGDECGLEIK